MNELLFDNDFSRIDILIKTIYRDEYLYKTIDAIRCNMSAARMVIMDDGININLKSLLYADLRREGHSVHQMEFDSGFGAKSNAAIQFYERDYVLIASDDFDFSSPVTCESIRRMVLVLDHDSSVGIVSGRVNDYPYEFNLHIDGTVCREIAIDYSNPLTVENINYHRCELTANYSMIRRELLACNKLHWWDDIKIGGGEHSAFFILAKKLGINVAYVEGVSIKEQCYFVGCQHEDYPGLRGRAQRDGRLANLREGITHYYLCGSYSPEVC